MLDVGTIESALSDALKHATTGKKRRSQYDPLLQSNPGVLRVSLNSARRRHLILA